MLSIVTWERKYSIQNIIVPINQSINPSANPSNLMIITHTADTDTHPAHRKSAGPWSEALYQRTNQTPHRLIKRPKCSRLYYSCRALHLEGKGAEGVTIWELNGRREMAIAAGRLGGELQRAVLAVLFCKSRDGER